MNVYYWPSVKALKRYAPGHVIVVASSLQDAVQLAVAARRVKLEEYGDLYDVETEEQIAALEQELRIRSGIT